MRTYATLLTLLLALGDLPACISTSPEPKVASSASHGRYAHEYPATLGAAVKDVEADRAEARRLMGEFPAFPGKLKDSDPAQVLEIIDRADKDGHSQGYVSRARRTRQVQAFFDAEREEVNRRLGSSIGYAAKKKGCDAEVGYATGPALKDAVDKQIEKHQREGSEAALLVERYRADLGKENAALLEKEADDIARASYLVRVSLIETGKRVEQLRAEARQVERAADQFIEDEKKAQASKKANETSRKASESRVNEMTRSKASLASSLQQADALVPTLEEEQRKLQVEYKTALDGLRDKIKEKRK